MQFPQSAPVVVLAALSLGELSASKLVSTPGAATFSEQLFMQLHTGTSSDLAARWLLLLASVLVLACLVQVSRNSSGAARAAR